MKKKTETRKKSKIAKRYVMYGFNKNDQDKTAYLKLSDDPLKTYELTNDKKQALVLKTYKKKWTDFFNNEQELKEWKFHPVMLNEKNESN